MCGIFGLIADSEFTPSDRVLDDLLGELGRRGPDGSGLEIGRRYALGHTRLSIVDRTARARQPMWDVSHTVCVTFNGEIYNYLDLREELVATGRQFRTRSDTEVLLEAYKAYGPDFVNRLDGMFAFCLYDSRRDAFLLARDRAGVKPLYWGRTPQGLAFGSEPKCVFAWPGFRRTVNPIAVSQSLAYRHAFQDTVFEGVHQLPPAHVMEVVGTRVSTRCFWRIDPLASQSRRPRQAVADFKAEFTGAVRRQAAADELPVGLFLSGGLDSTMLLDVLTDALPRPPTAFTATVDDPAYDEAEFAQAVACRYGAQLHSTSIAAADYLTHMPELTGVKDLPLAMHNEIAVLELARQARRTHKVVMSGEGADEISAGYGQLARTPFESWKRTQVGWGHGRAAATTGPLDLFLQRYCYFPFDEQRRLIRPELRSTVDEAQHASARIIGDVWREAAPRSGLTAVSLVLTSLHLPSLLQMMDSATMAVGLELRVPFTDHRLVELMFRLPDTQKLAWAYPGASLLAAFRTPGEYSERCDTTKVVFRNAFRDSAPRAALSRRKIGFAMPLGRWAATDWRPHVERVLLRDDGPLWQLFDRTALRAWAAHHLEGPADDSFGKKVWMLLALDCWWRLRL